MNGRGGRPLAFFGPPLGRPSLVRRLIVLAAAWSLAVLVAAGLSLSAFYQHAATARFDDELSNTVDGLLAGASVDAGRVIPPISDDPRTLRAYSGDYWEIATPGPAGLRALGRSRSLWDRALPPPRGGAEALAKAQGKTLFYDSLGPLGQPLRVAALQGRLPELAAPLVFMAAEDRSPVDRDVRTFATTIAAALVLLGAGLIAAVFLQVRVGLAPLFALRREVAAVRTGQSERVMGSYPSELEPLASELNALMAHNQEVVERQRTHVGNLAHALKTPLSVLLTEARQRPGQLGDVVIRQAEAMGHQVDHHLRRARAAARAQGQGERTAVAPVLEELSRTLEKIFRDKALSVDWRCPDDLCFQGERQDLLEVAGNVMENACKWCVGKVRVGARVLSPRQFSLTVEDDGTGLAADQRLEVLRRGARLDENAPGSGLGLAIVDELVRAYGGSVALSSSAMGGLKLELILPRADG
ncbi:MAG: sensor histidine kinase [Caulobacteraceae bacterium]